MTRLVIVAHAPFINQRCGKGLYSHMNGSMTSGPTQPRWKLQRNFENRGCVRVTIQRKESESLTGPESSAMLISLLQ